MHILTSILLGEMLLGAGALRQNTPLRVVHMLPGRLRVIVDAIRADEVLERRLREALEATEGISSVRAERRTGSVLILFTDSRPVREAIVDTLERITGEARTAARPTAGGEPLLRERIHELTSWLDRGAMDQSRGLTDLPTLAGVACFIWGGKILLHPVGESRWRGVTLLYWSYNILKRG